MGPPGASDSPAAGAAPVLRWVNQPNDPSSVVLVMHGGAVDGWQYVTWRSHSVLRLLPVARQIATTSKGAIAVARLRFAVRGWNGMAASPLGDARWALEQLRARYPGARIGLVGHSMGGRVALHLGADPDVVTLVGLAPWIDRADGPLGGPGLRALLIHGTRDRLTSPAASAAMVRQLTSRGVDAAYLPIVGEGHAFLRHPLRVQRQVARWLVEALRAGDPAR